jgi:hypothetical protein
VVVVVVVLIFLIITVPSGQIVGLGGHSILSPYLGWYQCLVSLLQGNVYHLQMKLKPSLNNFRKHPKLALLFLFALAVNVASLIVSPPFKNPSFKLYVEQGAVVLAVIVVGVLAFEFRERARYEYGFTELVVASFTALQIAIRTPFGHELLGQWTSLAGCVYVIVRGMANMSDANKEKNTDEAKGK